MGVVVEVKVYECGGLVRDVPRPGSSIRREEEREGIFVSGGPAAVVGWMVGRGREGAGRL